MDFTPTGSGIYIGWSGLQAGEEGSDMLDQARDAVKCARQVVEGAIETAKQQQADGHEDQAFLYDLSHAASAVEMADAALTYGDLGEAEERLAIIYIGKMLADLGAKIWQSGSRWGSGIEALAPAQEFVAAATDSELSLIHI